MEIIFHGRKVKLYKWGNGGGGGKVKEKETKCEKWLT